jgi:hypothetical protein
MQLLDDDGLRKWASERKPNLLATWRDAESPAFEATFRKWVKNKSDNRKVCDAVFALYLKEQGMGLRPLCTNTSEGQKDEEEKDEEPFRFTLCWQRHSALHPVPVEAKGDSLRDIQSAGQ